jgi:hypothetical protein
MANDAQLFRVQLLHQPLRLTAFVSPAQIACHPDKKDQIDKNQQKKNEPKIHVTPYSLYWTNQLEHWQMCEV